MGDGLGAVSWPVNFDRTDEAAIPFSDDLEQAEEVGALLRIKITSIDYAEHLLPQRAGTEKDRSRAVEDPLPRVTMTVAEADRFRRSLAVMVPRGRFPSLWTEAQF